MQQNQQSQNQTSHEDWTQYTDLPVGEILRRTRIHYGLSIDNVEGALRIRGVQLTALEEGNIEQLPGRVYAIGFVRAYAEFLGLDGDKIVHLFKAQLIGNKARPELSFPVSASESKLPGPFILGGSFLGLVLLAGVYFIISGSTQKPAIPDVPEQMVSEIAVYGPSIAEQFAAIEPAAGVEEPSSRVVINVLDNAWVEIRNKNKEAILSRVLKKGDSYFVPNEQGLVMDTGNVGVLEIVVDGDVIDPLGEPGDVRRSVSLDPAKLIPPPVVNIDAEISPEELLD